MGHGESDHDEIHKNIDYRKGRGHMERSDYALCHCDGVPPIRMHILQALKEHEADAVFDE